MMPIFQSLSLSLSLSILLRAQLDTATSAASPLLMINFASLSLGAGKAIGAGGTSKVYTGFHQGKPVNRMI
jgi:hypothetical protein